MQLAQQDFEILRDYIRDVCALEIGEDKKYLIESRLSPIMRDIQATDYQDFYRKLKGDFSGKLRNRFVDAITTHETLWFRDRSPWRIMEEVVLPDFAEQLRSRKRGSIKIWSAACSTGQEAYSLTMMIDHNIQTGALKGVRPSQFEILGTDISQGSVDTAIAGRYNQLEMARGLPPEYARKYFTADGTQSVLNEDIRRRVKFRVFNLKDNLLPLGRMDLILCRNVLIYFSEDFKSQLMRRFAMMLNPGAYFLLGSTESGLGHTNTFEMKEHNNAIYYQLKKF